MRDIAGPLLAAIKSPVTTLSCIVDIVCQNGRAFYMSASDRDIVYGGQTYKTANGCNLSQVQTVLGTQAESVTIQALLGGGISSGLIEAGIFDNAVLRVLIVDYTNLANVINFFEGYVSEVTYADRLTAQFAAQAYLSLDIKLAADLYSSNCRADLGDAKCKYPIAGLAQNFPVLEVINQQSFTYDEESEAAEDHYWQAGTVIFHTGANAGFSFEIADSFATAGVSGGTIQLKGIMPFPLEPGDTMTLYPGCDKTTTMCQQRYTNILNFQGEPFSVAPWITKSDDGGEPTDTGTGLYLYGTVANADCTTAFPGGRQYPRIPSWGPVPDQWNFSGAGVTTAGERWGPGTFLVNGEPGVGTFVPVYYVSTKLITGSIADIDPATGDVVAHNFGFSSEIELTQSQADAVKAAYPDAPYDLSTHQGTG